MGEKVDLWAVIYGTLIFHANTVATAKHRVFYDSTTTAITVMRGNCRVEKHGGDHRDFEKLNAVGECFRQKTRELYCNTTKQNVGFDLDQCQRRQTSLQMWKEIVF